MPIDKFRNEKQHPGDADLKKKIGSAFKLSDDTIKSLEAENKDITHEWKFSKTSGWYLTYNWKKKRLFYLFPLENDFTLKIVFNDKALKMIKDGSFPVFVYEMLSRAKKYPEGTLFVFNKSNFITRVMQDLLRIKIVC
jgi:hypothetical protein